jgi:tetratricopeptide (TPR) repeat protein
MPANDMFAGIIDFMMGILLFALLLVPGLAFGQKESAGRKKVDDGYKFQAKIDDSTATKKEVIANWSKIAQDADVRKDPDAWGIAYGCEALLRYQIGDRKAADSVMHRGIGKFRLRKSKAYFLVAFANMDRELRQYERAMVSYEEIVRTMDSLPELWDIDYYRLSGYAPYAYAIDACLGIARIGMANADYHRQAIELLTDVMDKHSDDALGVMALVSLHQMGAIRDEAYKFKLDLAASRHPDLRAASEKFEKQYAADNK